MESSVDKLEGLASKLTVEIPAEKIDQAVEKRLRALRPSIKIHGFRPGKVPPEIIKERYSASARQEILGQEIDVAYLEALKNTELKPVAQPEIKLISGFNEGDVLKFEAIFEVAPEVEVKGINELEVILPSAELANKDVDDMIETLRKQQATFIERAKSAGENDRITMDCVGTIDDVEYEGCTGKNVAVIFGASQMIPEIEKGLEGIKAGEERSFDVVFAENSPIGDLAGKTLKFSAKVHKVEEMELPEVDAEFIKKFGLKATDIETFKTAIKTNMERELEAANLRIRRECLFNAILAKNEDQIVPNSSLHQEMSRMAQEMQLDKQIPDEEKRHQLMHQLFEPQARRRLQLGFLLGKLFEERKIELDEDRVKARLDSIAAAYEDPAEVKRWYKKDAQARMSLESAILEEQLINQIYESVKITKEARTFQELMAINSQIRN